MRITVVDVQVHLRGVEFHSGHLAETQAGRVLRLEVILKGLDGVIGRHVLRLVHDHCSGFEFIPYRFDSFIEQHTNPLHRYSRNRNELTLKLLNWYDLQSWAPLARVQLGTKLTQKSIVKNDACIGAEVWEVDAMRYGRGKTTKNSA